jgi:integrase
MPQSTPQPDVAPPLPRRRPRPAGPYLQRRGDVFYFRKRLPEVLRKKIGQSFFCFSLRTPLLSEAMGRAARLLAVLQRVEASIMSNLNNPALTPEKINAVLGEVLRGELAQIRCEQDQGPVLSDTEIEARITALEAQRAELRRDARRQDFSALEAPVTSAAQALNLKLSGPLPASLGRRAVDLVREIAELETGVLDGDDARTEALPLVERFSTLAVDDYVRAPVLLSAAWERTLKMYPTKAMEGNINAIGQIALVYFGDVPVTSISARDQEAFFLWMARLPKSHGRAHGKNRFTEKARAEGRPLKERAPLTKDDEIAKADLKDEAIMQEIRARTDISDVEKRALLSEQLVARLTMKTLKRNRDGLNRLFKGAADLGCRNAPVAISYKAIERAVAAAAPDDPLYVRVTQPKLRMPWTEERLAAFLTCPIYTGCFSVHRRSRTGGVIIRDALYWVPLIVLTLGTRIEEILLLKRKNLLRRNGVHCLAIGLDPDQGGKTDDGQRVVPIPQLLLDLGFVEWVSALDDDHGPLLFPDAVERSEVKDLTGPFSKAFNRILDRLGLGDFDEDFYAMRKTLSSMLHAAKVPEGERQALAGHKRGTMLNRHYTAHNTRHLKSAVDRAEFRLELAFSAEHGFPVILSCGLAAQERLAVDVTLDHLGEAERIVVVVPATREEVFKFVRVDPESGARRPRSAVREAARAFQELFRKRTLCLPRNRMKRLAIEHFHALV